MPSTFQFIVSLTVDDFNKAISFYREAPGLSIENDWTTAQGRCIALSVPKAVIEIIDNAQAEFIDSTEVGKRVSGQVRFAFQFSDVQSAVHKAVQAGAEVIHEPIETPWKDINARLANRNTTP
jgi:methylmalonyl-CoA/ethylmalonyl-CoA epimerase